MIPTTGEIRGVTFAGMSEVEHRETLAWTSLGPRVEVKVWRKYQPEYAFAVRSITSLERFVRALGGGPIYREFRADGWPMCPRCGEDELFSLAIPPTVETIVGCYFCSWRPPKERWRDAVKERLDAAGRAPSSWPARELRQDSDAREAESDPPVGLRRSDREDDQSNRDAEERK